jgi:hypothetical protein
MVIPDDPASLTEPDVSCSPVLHSILNNVAVAAISRLEVGIDYPQHGIKIIGVDQALIITPRGGQL